MTIGQLLEKLERVKSTKDGWTALCPAHDDKNPSLSVKEGDDRRILFHCHAGCDPASVAGALGLTLSDLFVESKINGNRRAIEATYEYRDESGNLLFQAIRYAPKGFSQRRPDGTGGWIGNLEGVRRMLYRLPELLAASADETIYLVEGEKDVDRLRAGGLVATCNPMGAGKWRDEYVKFLRGRRVVIIPDNDQPGRDHAQAEAKSLRGVAASVKYLALSRLPDHGDVSDWLAMGGTVETLQAMAAAAPEWTPGADSQNPEADDAKKEICLTDIQIEAVDWLWEPRIPRGMLTLLEGIEGEGKSTVLCAIAAAVTCGKGVDGMVFDKGPGNVLWLSAEDSPGHVLKPRLLAAGADPLRVFVCGEAFSFDEDGARLVEEMAERRRPDLIVIDPVFAYADGDPSKGEYARRVTNRLKEIAERFNCAIVMVRHVGKSKGMGDPRAAGLYSIEWRAAARSVLLCGSDPDNPQIKALTQSKNNLSPLADSVGYKLVEYPAGSKVSRAEWTGVSQLTAKRILAQAGDADEQAEQVNAEDFLNDLLDSCEVKATEVIADAKKNGISERTLKRAKAKLGIKSRSEGFRPKVWYWRLPGFDTPEEGQPDAIEECHAADSGTLRPNDSKESTSSEQTLEECHAAPFVGNDDLRTMPSGPLREKFPINHNVGNGLTEGGHVGQVGTLRAQRKRVSI